LALRVDEGNNHAVAWVLAGQLQPVRKDR
jgi:hypothetical protein